MKFIYTIFFLVILPFLSLAQEKKPQFENIQKLLEKNNFKEALVKTNEILTINENVEVYKLRAKAYRGLKDYTNQIQDLKRILEINNTPDSRLELARAYKSIKDTIEAKRLLDINLLQHPTHANSTIDYAMWERSKGEYALALKILTDTYNMYKSPVVLIARATELRNQKKYKEAFEDYESLIVITKSSSFYMPAAILASNIGYHDKALEYYKKALDSKPNSSGILNDLASYLQRVGKFSEAEIYYKKAIDIAPTNVFPLAGQALLSYRLEKKDEAFTMLDASMLIKTNEKVHSLVRGYLNSYEGHLTDAENDFKNVESDKKQKSYSYNALGIVYIYKGEYAFAIEYLSKYIDQEQTATLYNTRGFAYYKLGKRKEALADFSKAIEIEKDFQPIFSYSKDGKNIIDNYTHIQFFMPFNDVNENKFGYFTDEKKDFDFKIRIISNEDVDPKNINLYESKKAVNPKYWSIKNIEKRTFKFMDMIVTDVSIKYTPSNKKSFINLSYAGTDTQTQTIIK